MARLLLRNTTNTNTPGTRALTRGAAGRQGTREAALPDWIQRIQLAEDGAGAWVELLRYSSCRKGWPCGQSSSIRQRGSLASLDTSTRHRVTHKIRVRL